MQSTPPIARITGETYRLIREDPGTGLARFRTDSSALALPLEVYVGTMQGA